MIQIEKYDKIIVEKIENKEIEIDIVGGKILGKLLDRNGKRKEIGSIQKDIKKFTFIDNGRCYTYPVNRAIYLFIKKIIPSNHIVYNIDGNAENNSIENLEIKSVKSGRFYYIRIWTEEDKARLKEIYKDKSYKELSEKFGRSIKAIRHAIKKLALDKSDNRKKWTIEDDKNLLEMYGNPMLTVKHIANKLFKSESSIRLRANRLGNIYRSDRHLQENLNFNNFYMSFKQANQRESIFSKCCLCEYNKYIELHHIDKNRKNNHISNIATLCPIHHTEVTNGEHQDKILYSIWQRKYSDGRLGKINNNLNEVKRLNRR